MNYLDATVTKILSEPYKPKWAKDIPDRDIWLVDVDYECCGGFGNQTLIFDSKSEAENLKVGHEFLT